MVGTHRSHGVGHSNSLDRARFIGGHVLSLHRWNAADAERSPSGHRPASDDSSERRSPPDLIHDLQGTLPIAELSEAAVHCHGEGTTDLNRVQAVLVAPVHQLRDRINVVDPTVGAERPIGLVLQTRHVFRTVRTVDSV